MECSKRMNSVKNQDIKGKLLEVMLDLECTPGHIIRTSTKWRVRIMKVKSMRITFGAMCLALSIFLPQVFHLFGMQQAGMIFLPMHLPVFLGGMLLGPVYGLFLGIFAPLISMVLTGMPGAERVIFMMIELAAYGAIAGLCYHQLKMNEKPLGTLYALIIAMIVGRVVNAIGLVIGGMVMGVPLGGFATVFASIGTGLPGIALQFIFVPVIVSALYKGGYFNVIARATTGVADI